MVGSLGYLVCCAHHNLSSSSCSTHNHKKYYSSLRVLHGNTLLPIRLRSTRHVWEHTNPLKPHRRTSLIKWHLTGMTYRKTMSLTLSYIIKPCSSEPDPTKTTYTQNLTRPALSHDRQNPHSKRSQPTSTKQTRPIPEVNKISVVDPTTYTKTRTPSIFTRSSQQSPLFP